MKTLIKPEYILDLVLTVEDRVRNSCYDLGIAETSSRSYVENLAEICDVTPMTILSMSVKNIILLCLKRCETCSLDVSIFILESVSSDASKLLFGCEVQGFILPPSKRHLDSENHYYTANHPTLEK